jgi:biopolymer transport protein ExbB/TolQ
MNINLGDFFFGVSQPIGTIINVLILAIGVLATLSLVRSWKALRNQQSELTRFDAGLGSEISRDSVLQGARALSRDSILLRRVDKLQELNRTGADIDASALSAIAGAELERQIGFTRWAASTSVLLGLGGTLVGLTQAVMAATPLLSNITTSADAVQAILETFAGLSTAFSTTLMGIIWAVLLGAAVSYFRRQQGVYLQHLEEISLVKLLPYFRTSASLAMVQAARSLSELEHRVSTELHAVVGEMKTQGLALTKIVEDSLEDVVGETRVSGRALVQEIEKSFTALIAEAQTRGIALVSTVDRSLEALGSELREGSSRLLDSYSATNERLLSFMGEPGADSGTIAQNLQALHSGVTALQSAAESMGRITPSIEEAIARQVDRQSRDMHETMHAYVGRLAESIERQDAVIDGGLIRLREGIPGFATAMANGLEAHAQVLAQVLESRTGTLVQASDQQAARLGELKVAVSQLAAAAESLRARDVPNASLVDAIREASAASTEELRALRGDIAGLARAIKPASTIEVRPIPRAVSTEPPSIPLAQVVPGNGGPPQVPGGFTDGPVPPKPTPKNLFLRWFS